MYTKEENISLVSIDMVGTFLQSKICQSVYTIANTSPKKSNTNSIFIILSSLIKKAFLCNDIVSPAIQCDVGTVGYAFP